jgi:hypothetical protein
MVGVIGMRCWGAVDMQGVLVTHSCLASLSLLSGRALEDEGLCADLPMVVRLAPCDRMALWLRVTYGCCEWSLDSFTKGIFMPWTFPFFPPTITAAPLCTTCYV